MGRSKIIDRGEETLILYPQVRVTDSRGNEQWQSDMDDPQPVRVTVSTDRQADASLAGQVSLKVLKLTARKPPLGSFVVAAFRGEMWDVAAPQTISSGASRAIRHVEFILRSRNKVVGG